MNKSTVSKYVVVESPHKYETRRGPWWVTNKPERVGRGKAPDAVCRSEKMATLIAKLLNHYTYANTPE